MAMAYRLPRPGSCSFKARRDGSPVREAVARAAVVAVDAAQGGHRLAAFVVLRERESPSTST